MGPVTRNKGNVTMLGGGGGVVQGRLLENSLNNLFFFFISLFYSLQRGSDCLSMVLFQRKLLFPGFRGSSIINPGDPPFSRGSNLFQGISNCVFFQPKHGYRTPMAIQKIVFMHGSRWGRGPTPLKIHKLYGFLLKKALYL